MNLGCTRLGLKPTAALNPEVGLTKKPKTVKTHPNPRHLNAQSVSWKVAIRGLGGGITSCPDGHVGCETFQLRNGRKVRDRCSARTYPIFGHDKSTACTGIAGRG